MEQLGTTQPINIAISIGVVAVALALFFLVLKFLRARSSSTFIRGGKNRQPRLAVLDAAAVDARRRLVLVRRDGVEHLILIGGPTDVVIESGIAGPSSTMIAESLAAEPVKPVREMAPKSAPEKPVAPEKTPPAPVARTVVASGAGAAASFGNPAEPSPRASAQGAKIAAAVPSQEAAEALDVLDAARARVLPSEPVSPPPPADRPALTGTASGASGRNEPAKIEADYGAYDISGELNRPSNPASATQAQASATRPAAPVTPLRQAAEQRAPITPAETSPSGTPVANRAQMTPVAAPPVQNIQAPPHHDPADFESVLEAEFASSFDLDKEENSFGDLSSVSPGVSAGASKSQEQGSGSLDDEMDKLLGDLTRRQRH